MEVFLRILKETGIAIVVLVLVALVVWLLFKEQLPFLGQDIPEPVEYAEINKNDFSTEVGIENETNPTQIYEATNEQLNGYNTDRIISTGLPNPFNSNNTEADVPTERVTITNPTILNSGDIIASELGTTDSGYKSLE